MKSDQGGRWWTLLALFAACSPVLGQSPLLALDSDNQAASLSSTLPDETAIPFQPALDDQASSSPQAPENTKPPYGWHYAIYPVLAWVPIFGASVTLPPIPSHPSESPSGTTNDSFNGAYFGGARLEPGKWSVDFLFMWAALSAERKSPLAKVNLGFVFGDAMVGHQVVPGLYVEGGFRRLALDLHATVETDDARRSPGYWDPIVGMTYRRQLGNKWRILLHGDGGGFGVGSDVDVTATGRAEWQFARHWGLSMGYGGMHFSQTDTVSGARLTISPTMHGPIFGLGIFL